MLRTLLALILLLGSGPAGAAPPEDTSSGRGRILAEVSDQIGVYQVSPQDLPELKPGDIVSIRQGEELLGEAVVLRGQDTGQVLVSLKGTFTASPGQEVRFLRRPGRVAREVERPAPQRPLSGGDTSPTPAGPAQAPAARPARLTARRSQIFVPFHGIVRVTAFVTNEGGSPSERAVLICTWETVGAGQPVMMSQAAIPPLAPGETFAASIDSALMVDRTVVSTLTDTIHIQAGGQARARLSILGGTGY